ncbi:hypothetical protein LT493_00935 [Streptomyces tricolor]|nr:hypothetical protein [Streptomyces tricolor]
MRAADDTDLIGRQAETGLLRAALDDVVAGSGEGAAFLLRGEAGLGQDGPAGPAARRGRAPRVHRAARAGHGDRGRGRLRVAAPGGRPPAAAASPRVLAAASRRGPGVGPGPR